MEVFDAHWTNAAAAGPPQTMPTGRRRSRGDHVLFRPAESWRVIESMVIDDRLASDHRSLLIVLEWIGGP
jgi:endonuclease/exonuclease/phosphatase (EEP) superfamily protein YafD